MNQTQELYAFSLLIVMKAVKASRRHASVSTRSARASTSIRAGDSSSALSCWRPPASILPCARRVGFSSTVAYERAPWDGLGSVPLSGVYRRHEPEKTVLHGIVREHLETFLVRARACDGDGYPRFVEREFRRYLDCGLLCHGFARLRCPQCGYERLVAFSCKGKLCPSCLARRAGDTAAWLVDHLLPEAGYRQWVLTFPWSLRFRLAMDRALVHELLTVFLRTL
ncbi:MAG: hypothetical protein FJY88_11655, partial [Candidatus Eisenbacteria bacterium]|nr:hypothetical protein [Candidatus Eisenbacteria bacterium]